jgi:hypothetical protein
MYSVVIFISASNLIVRSCNRLSHPAQQIMKHRAVYCPARTGILERLLTHHVKKQ